MLEGGFIKIFRTILKWEWYDDINTSRVFIHLLLTVNYENKIWHGVEIKKGSRVTSYATLAKETKLSVKNVRTAIKHLEMTGEVARSEYPQYTVFTLNNYHKFQGVASKTANETASKTAVKGQQWKNINKNKRNKEISVAPSEPEFHINEGGDF